MYISCVSLGPKQKDDSLSHNTLSIQVTWWYYLKYIISGQKQQPTDIHKWSELCFSSVKILIYPWNYRSCSSNYKKKNSLFQNHLSSIKYWKSMMVRWQCVGLSPQSPRFKPKWKWQFPGKERLHYYYWIPVLRFSWMILCYQENSIEDSVSTCTNASNPPVMTSTMLLLWYIRYGNFN